MHAVGNDYAYFDYEKVKFYNFSRLAVLVSKRRFSVGADGIIIVKRLSDFSVKMIMYNADGSRGTTCGNGVRCSAFFAKKYLNLSSDEIVVITDANQTKVNLSKKDGIPYAKADMGVIKSVNSQIIIAKKLQNMGLYVDYRQIFEMNAGNRHLVFFYPNHSLISLAKGVRQSNLFPDGINIERVYKIENQTDKIKIYAEIYERGSGKTLSCGSGACAIFSAFNKFTNKENKQAQIITDGGTLTVEKIGENTFLSSPVCEVFKGEILNKQILGEIDEIQPKLL